MKNPFEKIRRKESADGLTDSEIETGTGREPEIKEKGSILSKKNTEKNESDREHHNPEKEHHTSSSRIDNISSFVGHIIEPEERTFKNYLNIGFWKSKRELYRELREKEKQDQNVFKTLSEGARPTIEYYILTILSCLIATAGLLQGSTATIIGAMIVAPLMTPILAFSLGVIWGDPPLIRTSVLSLLKGISISLIISSAVAFAIPMEGYSQEIMSRTSPTMFDIIVAFTSGLVGAYGNANKRISSTLVGIAIAVALMPPLCTIGIGIGTLNREVASGAALLFLINLVSISLAGAIVFLGMKIHPISTEDGAARTRAFYQILISVIILTFISVPVLIFMKEGYIKRRALRNVNNVINEELKGLGITIIELKSEPKEGKYLFTATISGEIFPEISSGRRISRKAAEADSNIADVRVMFIKTTEIEKIPQIELK